MVGDTFVFDGVVHVGDMSFENMKYVPSPEEIEHILARTKRLLGEVMDVRMGDDILPAGKGSLEANYDVMFRNAPTDMAVVGNLPFFGRDNIYKDPDWPLTINYRLAEAY